MALSVRLTIDKGSNFINVHNDCLPPIATRLNTKYESSIDNNHIQCKTALVLYKWAKLPLKCLLFALCTLNTKLNIVRLWTFSLSNDNIYKWFILRLFIIIIFCESSNLGVFVTSMLVIKECRKIVTKRCYRYLGS